MKTRTAGYLVAAFALWLLYSFVHVLVRVW